MNIDKQCGASLIFIISFVFLFGFALIISFRVAPLYMTNYSVQKAFERVPGRIETLYQSSSMLLPFKQEVKRIIVTNLKINGVRNVPLTTLTFKRAGGNKVLIDMPYTITAHLINNLDVVAHFRQSALVPYRESR